jgi:hypothetical protein
MVEQAPKLELVSTGRWVRRNGDRPIYANIFNQDGKFVVELNLGPALGPARLDDPRSAPWTFRLPGSSCSLELAKRAAQLTVRDRFNITPNAVPSWEP